MATLTLLIFLTFSATCNANFYKTKRMPIPIPMVGSATAPPPMPGYNKNIGICDPARYSGMGLNMATFAFCNKALPFDVRAKDLVDSMTLDEKVGQLGDESTGVPRLGLPKYNWWSEALHGVSNVGHGTHFSDSVPSATSFPTPILTTASFNEGLWKRIGQAVSTEARAMYNLGLAGLTYWSPTMNVARDPRWGRIIETPGEDPFVVGTYAVNYVRGLQDVEGQEKTADLNTRPLKVAACCKHYSAYDVDNWFGTDRYHFDAVVTERDMVETFNYPFEMCVKEGDVTSVMCSYNRINGIPTCADPKLLNQTIRQEWNLHGYIVADCDSIQEMVQHHQFLGDTNEDAVAQTMKAGLDLDCGSYYPNYAKNAVMQGKMKVSDIDRSLRYLYVVLMRLGFFDGSPAFNNLGKQHICSDEHINLATDAARQGITLLRNVNNALPLDMNKIKTLALVGPHANATAAMIGNYAGIPCRYISPLDAFSMVANVTYAMGCADVACKNESYIFKGMEAAKNADATIIFAGLDLSVEAESLDRVSLQLPGYQEQLITQTAMSAKGPVILVIMSAGGVELRFAIKNPKIGAIIWAGYPGEGGGNAIKDIIYGKYNPGGRLPITWYEAEYVDQIPMTSMQLRPDPELDYPGRTYKFFNGSTVYPFSFGMSYSTIQYTLPVGTRALIVKLSPFQHCRDIDIEEGAYRPACPAVLVDNTKCDEMFQFQVQAYNNGSLPADHTVMIFSQPPPEIIGTHIKKLIGFKRIQIPAQNTQTVEFSLNVCKSFSIVDYTAYNVLPAGDHNVIVDSGNGVMSFPVHVYLSKDQGQVQKQ